MNCKPVPNDANEEAEKAMDEIREALMDSFDNSVANLNGSLSYDDFKTFVNQTRKSLYLSDADDDLMNLIYKKLDKVKSNRITRESLSENFQKIMRLIARPGKSTSKLIKKIFTDFDQKKKGYLTIDQLRIIFSLICDMMHVQRLEEWELEY